MSQCSIEPKDTKTFTAHNEITSGLKSMDNAIITDHYHKLHALHVIMLLIHNPITF